MLSQGIPMLLAGDERGRTQHGNNNPYCQDNETSWIDWENTDKDLTEFTAQLIRLRMDHYVFTRKKWFKYKPVNGSKVKDIEWFRPDGNIMTIHDWENGGDQAIGVYLSGDGIPGKTSDGKELKDDDFYVIFNAHHEPLTFHIPPKDFGGPWNLVMNTENGRFYDKDQEKLQPGDALRVGERSVVLLQSPRNQ